MKKSLAILGTIAVFSAFAPQLHAEDTIPKSLVLRLLKCPGECIKDMNLLIGKIPAPIAGTLSLPEKSTVIATVTRKDSTEIILDASQSPDQVRSQLKPQLEAKGWKSMIDFARDRIPGFEANELLPEFFTFCNSTDNSELRIVAERATAETMTDVRFHITPDAEVCQLTAEKSEAEIEPLEQFLIPRLAAPTAAKVKDTRFDPGEDEFYSSAKIETSMSIAALHKAYADQLTRAGWKKQSQQEQSKIVSSTWTVQDSEEQPRQGLLIFTAKDKLNEFSGVVLVMKP